MHLLWLATAILMVGLVFLLWQWPKSTAHSFSQHAATNAASIWYYFGLFVVTESLLATWFWREIAGSLHFGQIIAICFTVSALLQIACTLVPEIGELRIKIHRVFAGASGLLLLPIEWLLFISSTPSDTIQPLLITALVIQLTILIYLAIRQQVMAWPLQTAYYLAFLVPLFFLRI